MKEDASASFSPTFENCLEDLKKIADKIPAAVIIHKTADLSIVYMNQTGLDTLGISIHELQQLNQAQYHLRYFDTEESNDYVPKILQIIKSNTSDKVSYFQHVRN